MATYWADSGFMAAGPSGPMREDPLSWYVWHFTHKRNLDRIAAAGGLVPDSTAQPAAAVTDQSIKGRRALTLVVPTDAPTYPRNVTVADHVPWYFAPRSPTLFRVVTGYNLPYKEGHAPLVLLGLKLGDLAASGSTWCYSDRNAAANIVRFGTSVAALPRFIDFDLMSEKMWAYTRDDPDRPARRAAEVLVHGHTPIGLVSAVVTSNHDTLSVARGMLGSSPRQ
ncbi:MAG TPA: DUF4433 domain-containing protein [Acidimicrobiales bacterium]|nr:DUF4433 domain-containing protein [Acidimicrobiales bacterium]